jgi:hypothetical protein
MDDQSKCKVNVKNKYEYSLLNQMVQIMLPKDPESIKTIINKSNRNYTY